MMYWTIGIVILIVFLIGTVLYVKRMAKKDKIRNYQNEIMWAMKNDKKQKYFMGRLDACRGETKMSAKNCKIKICSFLNEEGWNSKLETFYYFGVLSERLGLNNMDYFYRFDAETYYRYPDDLKEWIRNL